MPGTHARTGSRWAYGQESECWGFMLMNDHNDDLFWKRERRVAARKRENVLGRSPKRDENNRRELLSPKMSNYQKFFCSHGSRRDSYKFWCSATRLSEFLIYFELFSCPQKVGVKVSQIEKCIRFPKATCEPLASFVIAFSISINITARANGKRPGKKNFESYQNSSSAKRKAQSCFGFPSNARIVRLKIVYLVQNV